MSDGLVAFSIFPISSLIPGVERPNEETLSLFYSHQSQNSHFPAELGGKKDTENTSSSCAA
jgi:hypothetical protein